MNFVDTNILIYAFGQDDGSGRPDMAREIIGKGDLAFSIQVFQEFFFQATHKRRKEPLSSDEALEVITSLAAFPVQSNDLPLFREAVAIQKRFQTSFWDANILAAAKRLGCGVVYSEDLNAGQDFGGVSVVNPFTVK
ncbi:MAG: PIN domain-containing protein [Verrucomicrobiales bacterium]|nr:PIN domain-containing protein [Verrucomicrobiales bacterium]